MHFISNRKAFGHLESNLMPTHTLTNSPDQKRVQILKWEARRLVGVEEAGSHFSEKKKKILRC